MKSLKMALMALILSGLFTSQAQAQEHGVNGLVLGAGSGALVGQAIGRDTEGTLIGTAVGGILGYMVGNEMDKNQYGRGYSAPQPIVYQPLPPPRHTIHHVPPPPPRYYSHRPPRGHYRHNHPDTICRETVIVNERHGRYRETVRTVCSERNDRPHRPPRPRDWYGYNDRW